MRRAPWGLMLVLAAAPAWAQRSEEEAGDVSEVDKDASGPLRDRIRPVSGHLFLMDGRFELSPTVGISVRDAFFTKVLFGAAVTYHFSETFAASLRAAYALSLISNSAQICTPVGSTTGEAPGCRAPKMEELTQDERGAPANKAFGLLTFLGSFDLQWAPVYGKLALFSENVLYFNMYGLAGPALVIYGPSSSLGFGGNVGIGFRFALNSWLAIRLELRDTLYAELGYAVGYDGEGVPRIENPASFRNQLTAELGLSMFFPTVFGEK